MEPIRFRCPSCNQALRAGGEKAGRKVRCTRCHKLVLVPEEEPPVIEKGQARLDETETLHQSDVEQGERAGKGRARRSDRWRLARLGLLTLLVGTGVAIAWALSSHAVSLVSSRVPGLAGSWNVLIWLTGGFSAVGLLTQSTGYALCASAPSASGARPYAITALVCTCLTWSLSLYLNRLSKAEAERVMESVKLLDFSVEVGKEHDPQAIMERTQKMLRRSQQMLEDSQQFSRRVKLYEVGQTLFGGVLVFAVPLMLRAFCRGLRLTDIEPNCDGLLKIGAALIGIQLLSRMLLALGGVRVIGLFMPVSLLAGLAHLAWNVLFVVLLWQIWQAKPARR